MRLVLAMLACGCSAPSTNGTQAQDAASPAEAGAGSEAGASLDARGDGADADAGADAGSACPDLPSPTLVPSSAATMAVQGDPGSPLGIYDPSLAYPRGAGGGVLAYSSVALNSVHTRVAVSTDLGATFQFVSEANAVTPVTVTTSDPAFCDGGPCTVQGVLWHEVPSIVADPTDVAAPYKLFVHTYVSASGGAALRRDWGYIGYQTATTPTAWSKETPLLGWTSSAPLSTAGVAQVLTAVPQLADCIAFTEPGAYVGPLGIDLALSCAYVAPPGVVKIRVELLRSTDHAASFQYVGPLLAADDDVCLGGGAPQILGADLFSIAGAEYLIVSPTGPVTNGDAGGYVGCVTIPFADAGAGLLARAANGAPAVASFVRASDGRFTGPCTYAEGATAAGELVPMQFSASDLPLFRIAATGIAQP